MTPADYEYLYSSCSMTSDLSKLRELDVACRAMIANQTAYKSVSIRGGAPWIVVAAIHYRESGQRFNCHFHNGDPLTARTVHAPIGRPLVGQPPFTWVQSALDALSTQRKCSTWNIGSALDFCERYNGTGYQKHDVNTPYVWSYTDKYTSGLFVSDGSFDPKAVSRQAGCAALFKYLERMGTAIDFRV